MDMRIRGYDVATQEEKGGLGEGGEKGRWVLVVAQTGLSRENGDLMTTLHLCANAHLWQLNHPRYV